MVYFSFSPIHSVLFLILAFVNASFILLLFNVEFLALLFIIIYVGALAVLFLFIVMMLNTKNEIGLRHENNVYIFFCLLCVFFLINFDFIFSDIIGVFNHNKGAQIFLIDSMVDIVGFGQSLYNYYLMLVLLGGLILLVAMVGAIILTFEFKTVYSVENSLRQLSRTTATVKLFK